MKQTTGKYVLVLVALLAAAGASRAQAPEGPLTPRPGQPIQQAPPDAQAKLKVQVALVNMPVTVRNAKGEMVTLTPRIFGSPITASSRGSCISILEVIRFPW